MDSEEWRDIPGFEGQYQVSSHGRVKSCARVIAANARGCRKVAEKIMKQAEWLGYKVILLNRNKRYRIHRLVAMAFIPNPDHKEFVNHIDRNRQHNHVSNLEWNSPQENSRHWIEDDRAKLITSDAIPF